MNRRASEASKYLFLIFTLVLFIVFSTASFADRASSTSFITDFDVGIFSSNGQLNSSTNNFRLDIGGSNFGGNTSNSSYIVTFGILAGAVVTTTTTTTTLASGGTSGPISYSSQDNRIGAITVDPGANVTIKSFKNISIAQINIIVNKSVTGGSLELKKLTKDAITVSQPTERVFEFLQITKANLPDESLRKVKIRFNVARSWLTENNVGETQVALQRYESGSWRKLPTQKISDDSTNILFESDSPGLSFFAITALAVGETPPAVLDTTTETTLPSVTSTTAAVEAVTTTLPPISLKPSDYTALGIAAVLLLIIIGAVFMRKK